MEIPDNLKLLYRHWESHTVESKHTEDLSQLDQYLLNEISSFASERMRIWEQKVIGKAAPYTADLILQKYRFCNIYRELDRQTIQIHTLLNPLRADFATWLLNLMYCRFSCSPATVGKTGLLSFNETNNKKVYEKLMRLPRPKYGSAYVFPINSIAKTGCDTRELFFCRHLPSIATPLAEALSSIDRVSVTDLLDQILPILGVNMKFHMTEVLIDVAYQYPEKVNLYKDFHIGPGAEPTLKRLSRDIAPEDILNMLPAVRIEEFPYLKYNGMRVTLSSENWEGIACEFRKYSNLRKGAGRVRLYR